MLLSKLSPPPQKQFSYNVKDWVRLALSSCRNMKTPKTVQPFYLHKCVLWHQFTASGAVISKTDLLICGCFIMLRMTQHILHTQYTEVKQRSPMDRPSSTYTSTCYTLPSSLLSYLFTDMLTSVGNKIILLGKRQALLACSHMVRWAGTE